MLHKLRIAVIPLLLLWGCGPRIDAPSLMPRAAEKQAVEFPSATNEGETPLDPSLGSRIAAIVASAEAQDRQFMAARADVARAVGRARGSEPGSEAWTVAQQALSALDVARGGVRAEAANLDELRQDPAAAGTGNRAAIEAAAERIAALDAGEARAVATLQSGLR